MQAIWLVRSRQLTRRMKFWIAIVGYDPTDRSISHQIYLIYVIIFFSIWGFAVLALLADQMAGILSLLVVGSPVQGAITLLAVIILADFILHFYRYARRSPFVFSDDDAVLICLTPVDRRQVALTWLFGDWIPAGLPYWTAAVTFSFCILQLTQGVGIIWSQFPFYILSGLRAVSIMLPLHLGLMAITYVVGALRLRRNQELPFLRLIPISVGAGLLLLVKYNPLLLSIIIWPVVFPLEAAFGMTFWMQGLALSVLIDLLSFLALYLVTPELNLSRASQESLLPSESRNIRLMRGKS